MQLVLWRYLIQIIVQITKQIRNVVFYKAILNSRLEPWACDWRVSLHLDSLYPEVPSWCNRGVSLLWANAYVGRKLVSKGRLLFSWTVWRGTYTIDCSVAKHNSLSGWQLILFHEAFARGTVDTASWFRMGVVIFHYLVGQIPSSKVPVWPSPLPLDRSLFGPALRTFHSLLASSDIYVDEQNQSVSCASSLHPFITMDTCCGGVIVGDAPLHSSKGFSAAGDIAANGHGAAGIFLAWIGLCRGVSAFWKSSWMHLSM